MKWVEKYKQIKNIFRLMGSSETKNINSDDLYFF